MSPECESGLVSVIVPTRDRQELLQNSILSALRQTYPKLEVIVVDDGSSDGTEERVRALIAEYGAERLRYVKQQRQGACAARNYGLRLSRGEFIQFLDSDDVIHPEKVQKQVALLQANKQLQMTYCATERFRNQPGDLGIRYHDPSLEPDMLGFVLQSRWQTNAPLWRREVVLKIGPWNTDLAIHQDLEYHIRALSLNLRLARTDDVGNYVRLHQDDRITNGMPSLEKARSGLVYAQLVLRHLVRARVASKEALEVLASRATYSGLMFLSLNAPRHARQAWLWGASLRSSVLRQLHLLLLCCISYAPAAARIARLMMKPSHVMAVLFRRLRLLPRIVTR